MKSLKKLLCSFAITCIAFSTVAQNCIDRNNIFNNKCKSQAYSTEYDEFMATGNWLEPSNKSVPATISVNSYTTFSTYLNNVLKPGDILEVDSGTWHNKQFVIRANGTKEKPITIRAKSGGQVILTDNSRVWITGKYIRFEGLKFTGDFTSTPSAVALSVGYTGSPCEHCLVSDVVFEKYNPNDSTLRTHFVWMMGQWNRITRSTFKGKYNGGNMLATSGNSVFPNGDYFLIDSNYFFDQPDGYKKTGGNATNGFETIAIYSGEKGVQTELAGKYWAESYIYIRNNLFLDCNGEGEIITVKASKVAIQNNTFEQSGGAVTIRAGNNCVVEGNVFASWSGELDRTGGVRVNGRNNAVIHNIFQVLNPQGFTFMFPLTLYKGDIDPLDSLGEQYVPVTKGVFAFNLFAHNKNNVIFGDGYSTSTLFPAQSEFSYNYIYQSSLTDANNSIVNITGTNISMRSNKLSYGSTNLQGFIKVKELLPYNTNRSLYLVDTINAPYLEYTDRLLYKAIYDSLQMDSTNKFDILKRMEYVNRPHRSVVPFIRYKSSDAGNSIGARNYVVKNPTNVKDHQLVGEITIFPNPNEGNFTLKFALLKNTDLGIEITDLTGKSVYSQSIRKTTEGHQEIVLQLQNLNAGIYICNIYTPEGTISRKISIVK